MQDGIRLIAALTKHHRYAEGGCLNLVPVGNNELARSANVSESTTSAFSKDEFRGHTEYKALCRRNPGGLALVLRKLNGELPGHELLSGRGPVGDPDDE